MHSGDRIDTAVIAAGGLGTRLSEKNKGLPKALTPFNDSTIIDYQIKFLKNSGISTIYFLLGHKGYEIKDQILKNYHTDEIKLIFFEEPEPMGSGGALLYFLAKLPNIFFFTYCDIYFDFDIQKLAKKHFFKNADFSIVVHPNDHPFDSDLVECDEGMFVKKIHPHPHVRKTFPGNLVNAAFYILSKNVISQCSLSIQKHDFAQDIIPNLLTKELNCYAYKTTELLKDMGTPLRLENLNKLLVNKRDSKFEKVIFIDRDGTINKCKDGEYIRNAKEINLYQDVKKSLVKLRLMGYKIIIITNQPIIARGCVSFKGMKEIHNELEYQLAQYSIYIDEIYYCPHHPDGGFDGERPELKTICECRKPNIGLFKKATRDINICFEKSWMVGDSYRDIDAGINFGINSCLIDRAGKDYKYENNPTLRVNSLNKFVEFLDNNTNA